MDIAFLIVRLIVGLALAAHGAQKLFGWFGGPGLRATAGAFENLGFRPGIMFAWMAGLGETGGGLLTLLGLGGALGPVLIVLVMIVAVGAVHISKGFFISNGGWDSTPLTSRERSRSPSAATARIARQRVASDVLTQPEQIWFALAAAAIVALLNLLARRPVKA